MTIDSVASADGKSSRGESYADIIGTNLLDCAKGFAQSAVEDPINAIGQAAKHAGLGGWNIDGLRPASDSVGAMIGKTIGAAVDLAVLSRLPFPKLLGKASFCGDLLAENTVANKALSVGLSSSIYGGLLVPTNDNNFVSGRLSSAAKYFTQMTAFGGASGVLESGLAGKAMAGQGWASTIARGALSGGIASPVFTTTESYFDGKEANYGQDFARNVLFGGVFAGGTKAVGSLFGADRPTSGAEKRMTNEPPTDRPTTATPTADTIDPAHRLVAMAAAAERVPGTQLVPANEHAPVISETGDSTRAVEKSFVPGQQVKEFARQNEPLVERMELPTNLGDIMSKMDPAQRYDAMRIAVKQLAWKDAQSASESRTEYNEKYGEQILKALPHLENSEALKIMALGDQYGPETLWGGRVAPQLKDPMADVPQLISYLSGYNGPRESFPLLRSLLNIRSIIDQRTLVTGWSPEARADLMERSLNAANGSEPVMNSIRSWIQPVNGYRDNPMMGIVASRVAPKALAQFIFGNVGPEDAQLLDSNPNLVRAFATTNPSLEGMMDGYSSPKAVERRQRILNLFHKWNDSGSLKDTTMSLFTDWDGINSLNHVSTRAALSALGMVAGGDQVAEAANQLIPNFGHPNVDIALATMGATKHLLESQNGGERVATMLDKLEDLFRQDKGLPDRLALLKAAQAWRDTGSIFDTVKAQSEHGYTRGKFMHDSLSQLLAEHLAKTDPAAIVSEYANNLFKPDVKPEDLREALLSVQTLKGQAWDTKKPQAFEQGSEIPDELKHSRDVIRGLLTDDLKSNTDPAAVVDAVNFAHRWLTSGSLKSAWQAMESGGDRSLSRPDNSENLPAIFNDRQPSHTASEAGDSYVRSTIRELAKTAKPEQLREFSDYAIDRIMSPHTPARESENLIRLLAYRPHFGPRETKASTGIGTIRFPADFQGFSDYLSTNDATAVKLLSDMIDSPDHRRGSPPEVAAVLNTIRQWHADPVAQAAWTAAESSGILAQEGRLEHVHQTLSKLIASDTTANQSAAVHQMADRAFDPSTDKKTTQNILSTLFWLGRDNKQPLFDSASAHPREQLMNNITTTNFDTSMLNTPFVHRWFASHSLTQAWESAFKSANWTTDHYRDLSLPQFEQAVAAATAASPLDEQVQFRQFLQGRTRSPHRQESAAARELLQTLDVPGGLLPAP